MNADSYLLSQLTIIGSHCMSAKTIQASQISVLTH